MDDWGDIPQEDWDNIVLSVSEEGQWSVEFTWEDDLGRTHYYEREEISWDQFLDIYDMAGALDQEIEIEY